MKKLFAVILSVVMLATMSVTAFAVENTGGDTAITVKGTYNAASKAEEIVSVTVAWDEMNFAYTAGSEGTWNPTTHVYDDTTEGAWSTETKRITVTNHSNVAVTATLDFTATVNGVIGTFTETSGTANDQVLSLTSAAEGDSLGNVNNAPTASAAFGISGAAIDADKDLGTITVTVKTDATTASTVVDTYTGLVAALANGGTVKLGANIDMGNTYLTLSSDTDATLDLNGYTLSSTNRNYGAVNVDGATLTIMDSSDAQSGAITGARGGIDLLGGEVTINSGSVSGSAYGAYGMNVTGGTVNVNGGLVSGDYAVLVDGGVVNVNSGLVSGNSYGMCVYAGTVNVNGGSVSGAYVLVAGTFNFDPAQYVNTNSCIVTNNGDGTWTVTEKS